MASQLVFHYIIVVTMITQIKTTWFVQPYVLNAPSMPTHYCGHTTSVIFAQHF